MFASLVVVSSLASALAAGPAASGLCTGSLWPLPASANFGMDSVGLAAQSGFSWQSSIQDDILSAAFKRYSGLIFASSGPHASAPSSSATVLTGVSVNLSASSSEVPLALGVNETFEIAVPNPATGGNGVVQINAPTVWGALRALETFSQLVLVGNGGSLSVACVPISIIDYPRFPVRAAAPLFVLSPA